MPPLASPPLLPRSPPTPTNPTHPLAGHAGWRPWRGFRWGDRAPDLKRRQTPKTPPSCFQRKKPPFPNREGPSNVAPKGPPLLSGRVFPGSAGILVFARPGGRPTGPPGLEWAPRPALSRGGDAGGNGPNRERGRGDRGVEAWGPLPRGPTRGRGPGDVGPPSLRPPRVGAPSLAPRPGGLPPGAGPTVVLAPRGGGLGAPPPNRKRGWAKRPHRIYAGAKGRFFRPGPPKGGTRAPHGDRGRGGKSAGPRRLPRVGKDGALGLPSRNPGGLNPGVGMSGPGPSPQAQ